jgi:hypothetical protein
VARAFLIVMKGKVDQVTRVAYDKSFAALFALDGGFQGPQSLYELWIQEFQHHINNAKNDLDWFAVEEIFPQLVVVASVG